MAAILQKDAEAFESDLSRVQAQVLDWIERQKAHLDSTFRHHEENVHEEKQKISKLDEECGKLRERVVQVGEEDREKIAKVREMEQKEGEISSLVASRKEAASKKAEQNALAERIVHESADKVMEREKELREKQRHFTKGLETYEEVLGIKVNASQAEDEEGNIIPHVMFTFVKVNPRNLGQEHSLNLLLVGDKYKLYKCSPALPRVDQDLMKLNGDGDLGAFIRTCREKFVSLYAH
eukprot:TRINITY_DN2183_c0_g1_i1.p1 TRINITY_DN2183_c0_g1~~TRINITY_DN2183_c0_g1_i1.p1  ORF type:complete len:237 (-),score=85.12 TRINITY_DN2183_c0_g1_i1:572-1282(-)